MCSLSCSTEVNEAPVSEMTLRRSNGGTALFPLRVTGAGGTDSVRVMLRDLPETVWLSNGVRQDEHTWGLRLADLEDLLRTPVAPPQAPGVATPFRTEVKEVPRVEELAGAVPPTPPPTPAWAPFGNGASGN